MEEVHILGTTVKILIEFRNNDTGELCDATTLKYRVYLDSHTPLGSEVVLVPASAKMSTGLYAFNYTIPADLDVDTRQQVVFIVTATVGGLVKVKDVPLQVDWKPSRGPEVLLQRPDVLHSGGFRKATKGPHDKIQQHTYASTELPVTD
jgi:hypothetical protein